MAEPIPTLKTIFGVTRDEATTAILNGVDKKVWGDVAIPTFLLKAASSKIGAVLDDVLTTPLPDILSGAWNEYRKYCKFAHDALHPTGIEHEIPEEHFSIESKHTPYVDLLINGKPRGKVEFPITLTLTFDGAVVVVRDGQFVAIRTGSCTAAGEIRCESTLLKKIESSPLALPGRLSFGQGIAILPCP